MKISISLTSIAACVTLAAPFVCGRSAAKESAGYEIQRISIGVGVRNCLADDGTIAGYVRQGNSTEAAVWRYGDAISLKGITLQGSWAEALAQSGFVCGCLGTPGKARDKRPVTGEGVSLDPPEQNEIFVWRDGITTRTGVFGVPYQINDKGALVGVCSSSGPRGMDDRAFVWEGGKATLIGLPGGRSQALRHKHSGNCRG